MTRTPVSRLIGCILLIVWVVFPAAAERPADPSVTVRTVTRYVADSPEAASIAAWIDRVPGADKRTNPLGTLRVIRVRSVSGEVSTAGGPPVPLPANGVPGETITISNTLPGGIVESWTFEWVGTGGGGGWKQTHYESHAPVTQPDRPNEL